jgi:hypothetical protein
MLTSLMDACRCSMAVLGASRWPLEAALAHGLRLPADGSV